MKILIVICLTFFGFTSQNMAQGVATAPTYNVKSLFKRVVLSAGSSIFLETTETINSDNATIGQLVRFKVQTNVYAEGKVVVVTGAMATGRVKAIEKSSYNHGASIRVEVTSVQAVDGQMINLNGMEQTLTSKYKGQGITIATGTAITATVMNDIKIKL